MKNTIRTIVAITAVITAMSMLSACGSTEQPAAETTTTTTTTAETTTTTEATTAAAPETTTEADTEAVTTTAEPETTTEATTAEADDGMYTMEECIRRVIRDNLGQEVVSFETSDYGHVWYVAVLEDGENISIFSAKTNLQEIFEREELTSINNYIWKDMTEEPLYDVFQYGIVYANKK